VPVTAEVDLLDVGRAVGHSRAGHQRVHGSATLVDRLVDGRLVAQVHVDGLGPRQLHLGVVHDDDFGTGVEGQLGGRGTHAGGASDHQDALAVVTECIEQRHVLSPD